LFGEVGRRDEAAALGVEDRTTRNANIQRIYTVLETITRTKTTAEWLAICRRLDIPAMRLIPVAELPEQPHLREVGMFEIVQHPHAGEIRVMRPPTKFSATPASIRRPAPRLGEHNNEILTEAGYTQDDIATLKGAGILQESA